jgi:hypothetical protein
MKEKELDYFSDLEIDNDNLDKEFDQQHILFMQYYQLLADKKDKVNEQKRIIKIKEAIQKEVYNKVYLKYYSIKDEKGKSATVNVLNAQTETDPEYLTAMGIVFKEMKELNRLLDQEFVLDGIVKSFQQRKNNLESKRDLWILGYNGQVRTRDSKEKIIDSIHKRINKGKTDES